MRVTLRKILCIITAVVICILFGGVLSIYINPMEDASYDLSLMVQDGYFTADPENFDEKGWRVYTCEGDTVTALTPTGLGSYSGIELGQTLYFSRVMEEELDSPTLQLGTAEQQFVVFLDDEVIYTDCPELEARIGYLRLPMNDYVREDPITITLPQNYQGKTLTIAQSTPEYSETSHVWAYPCNVHLYCGYSYESGLIAESYMTAISAAAAFAVGVILLALFVRSRRIEVLCIALVAFLWMSNSLIDTSFFSNYFSNQTVDSIEICRFLAVLALLVFLIRQAGKFKKILWGLVGLYGASLIVYAAVEFAAPFSINPVRMFLGGPLSEWIAVVAFLVILVLGAVFWRKESRFYRLFTPLAIISIVAYWAVMLVTDAQMLNAQLSAIISSVRISYFYVKTLPLMMATSLLIALVEAVRNELALRAEKQLLEERREMEQTSYENMRRQHEEVMKLRHDMLGHLETLRGMQGGAEATAYIDELIGRDKQIRPVVHTGNKVLDIILNSKLSAAIDDGIKVEISNSAAPEKLPLSDVDLSSIVINILNNAITAAKNSGAQEPFLKLDVHIKDSWLAIVCENSADIRQIETKAKKETVPKHGLGLKIIEQTTGQYDGLFDTVYGEDYYRVSVVLPLG